MDEENLGEFLLQEEVELVVINLEKKIDTPEKNLAFRVLNEALHDLSGKLKRKEMAESWFFEDDYEWIFSFVNIATMFNLDIAAVRRRIREQPEALGYAPRPLGGHLRHARIANVAGRLEPFPPLVLDIMTQYDHGKVTNRDEVLQAMEAHERTAV